MDELTQSEWKELALLCEGLRNQQIADQLFIGSETVKSHLKAIYRKLGVHSRTEAVAFTMRADRTLSV